MPDSTLSTLEQIIKKVRRLTRSPSQAQLTDTTIKEYINTFVLYDFPSSIKSEFLKTVFSFYTKPYIDKYSSSLVAGDILYNLNNRFSTFYSPVYIDGVIAMLYTSRELFYNDYPTVLYKKSIATGDGATVAYAGTLPNIPVLSNHILFSGIDANNEGLAVYDDGDGNLSGDCIAGGTIDYITGEYDFTFTAAPKDTVSIYSQTYYYDPSKPQSVLFYKGSFYVRPIPDGSYKISLEACMRPTELLANDQSPDLAEWWQYIAYGAAKKVFEDRMDVESIKNIYPEMINQEILINRRVVLQQSQKKVATIYNSSTNVIDSET